jgi:hypothetical protein
VQPATGGRDDLGGRFCTWEGGSSSGIRCRGNGARGLRHPGAPDAAAELKDLVEGSQGVTDE